MSVTIYVDVVTRHVLLAVTRLTPNVYFRACNSGSCNTRVVRILSVPATIDDPPLKCRPPLSSSRQVSNIRVVPREAVLRFVAIIIEDTVMTVDFQ